MSPGAGKSVNTLLVDDQPIIAHGVRKLLNGEPDLILHYCQDPRKAFTMAREVEADLILQDLTMPDIDGITLVRFFRNHPATKMLPIIILSGKESPRDKQEGFLAGANDYVVKLPDRLELIERIRFHVKSRRAVIDLELERERLKGEVDELAAEVEKLMAGRKVIASAHQMATASAEVIRTQLERIRQYQDQLLASQLTDDQRWCVNRFAEAVSAIRAIAEGTVPVATGDTGASLSSVRLGDRPGDHHTGRVHSTRTMVSRAPKLPS